jgi:hypothetical protein
LTLTIIAQPRANPIIVYKTIELYGSHNTITPVSSTYIKHANCIRNTTHRVAKVKIIQKIKSIISLISNQTLNKKSPIP